jgi:hypothetical protein
MTRLALREFVAHHDDRWLFVAIYIGLAVVLSIALSLFWLVAVAGLHFGLEYFRQAQHRNERGEIVTHALWEIKLDVALVLLALAMALYMDIVLGVLGLQSAARATAATRAGMRATRMVAWERNIRAAVLMADDLARVIQIGIARMLRRGAAGAAAPEAVTARSAAGGAAAGVAVKARPAEHGAAAASTPQTVAATAGRSTAGRTPAAAAAAGTRAVVRDRRAAGAELPRSWRDGWTFGDRVTMALLVGCALLIVMAPALTQRSWGGATVALIEQLHPFPPRQGP